MVVYRDNQNAFWAAGEFLVAMLKSGHWAQNENKKSNAEHFHGIQL